MAGNSSTRLLLVESDTETARRIHDRLSKHFGPGCVVHTASLQSALDTDLSTIDLVFADMHLPDGSGLDLLDQMLRRRADLPVVLLTGEAILENAIAAIGRGAYDYVVKAGDWLFAVPIVVEKNLALWRVKRDNHILEDQLTQTLEEVRVKNRQLEDAVKQLQAMAATDPLTGLANRRAFGQTMVRLFAEAVRHNYDLSCLMIDLDGFKQLNDSLGHQRGDDLLAMLAQVLIRSCRMSDVAARFGGDEFIVLLPQSDEIVGRQVAQRILDAFTDEAQLMLTGIAAPRPVTLSMGLSGLHTTRSERPEQLIACADLALYRAKEAGKNRLWVHDPQSSRTSDRASALVNANTNSAVTVPAK